ncbi:MAG: hypothetical protein NTW66_00765 [Candidatus Magasanikbacteria bacterium]|nr:hypothetical protein [Candidatus Magasanikbacteria bacterium]
MLQKIAKIALILAGYFLVISFVSNTFDGDFGWHLRFGRDAFAGNFQYLDTYTWPHFGLSWTNHEWGGDLLFWLLYSSFGYFSLVLLISAAIWGAFLLAQKIFFKKISISGIILSLAGIACLKFLLGLRLAFLVLMLFTLLWLTLEKLPKIKSYFLWPPLLWLWSALHGSWALGFIIINIYTFGNIIYLMIKNKFPRLAGKDTGWTGKTILASFFWQAISALFLLFNPYGTKIWTEVGEYFTSGYFKTIITEWIPSYAYPVYVWPLIIAAFTAVFAVWGWLTKKVTLAQLLFFFAIFYSAWQYKRNNVYLVLICIPALTIIFGLAKEKIISAFNLKTTVQERIALVSAALAIMLIALFAPSVRINSDIWKDRELLLRYPFPYDAVEFLTKETVGRQIYLFNEFHWGGYLNWTMPDTLIYFDGRGTATWKYSNDETRLERYRKIKYQAGGFNELEQGPAEYVILSQYYASYKKPNMINKIIFGEKGIAEALVPDPPQLEKMLRKSGSWQIIFEDKIAIVWKRVNKTSPTTK